MSDFEKFKSALDDYLNGIADKSGVGPIDILIVQQRQTGSINAANNERTLLRALSGEIKLGRAGVWTVIRLYVEKLQLKSKTIQSAISKALDTSNNFFDLQDRYQAIRCFISAGGYFTPKLLNFEVRLRNELSAYWFDLALITYSEDVDGLIDVIRPLVSSEPPKLTWIDIRRRLQLIVDGVGAKKITYFILQTSKMFKDNKNGEELLAVVDKTFGTTLQNLPAPPAQVHRPRTFRVPFIQSSSIQGFVEKEKQWSQRNYMNGLYPHPAE